MIQAYRVEKTITENKSITLTGLPFSIGDKVEILILRQPPLNLEKRYPLRGRSIQYERPFASVAESDWEVTR